MDKNVLQSIIINMLLKKYEKEPIGADLVLKIYEETQSILNEIDEKTKSKTSFVKPRF